MNVCEITEGSISHRWITVNRHQHLFLECFFGPWICSSFVIVHTDPIDIDSGLIDWSGYRKCLHGRDIRNYVTRRVGACAEQGMDTRFSTCAIQGWYRPFLENACFTFVSVANRILSGQTAISSPFWLSCGCSVRVHVLITGMWRQCDDCPFAYALF